MTSLRTALVVVVVDRDLLLVFSALLYLATSVMLLAGADACRCGSVHAAPPLPLQPSVPEVDRVAASGATTSSTSSVGSSTPDSSRVESIKADIIAKLGDIGAENDLPPASPGKSVHVVD